MISAFVLSGGGSLGAVQVAMLQALAARGVQPERFLSLHRRSFNVHTCHGGEAA